MKVQNYLHKTVGTMLLDPTARYLLGAGGGGAVTSLTVTGTSGAATLSGGVLNIPTYTSTAGTVTSVSNSDSTITVATGTTTPVVSLNLAHANTWTALQTYTAAINSATINGGASSAGTLTFASTTNAAKGFIKFGTSNYDDTNNRLGINVTPSATFHIGALAGANGGINLNLLTNASSAANSYESIDFNVPTSGLIGQFFATANNYSAAGVNLASASIGLVAEALNGQLLLGAVGTSGYISFNAGGFAVANEAMRIFSSTNVSIGRTTDGGALFNIGAGTTAKAQLNLASSTAPTSPNNGDTWFTGTATFIQISGVTQTFAMLASPTFTGTVTTPTVTFGAGTSAVSPQKFTLAGAALLTSAVAGAVEVDANGIQYYTHATNERGVVDAEQFSILTAAFTIANQTALTQAFNSSTNGAVTLASTTTYFFECVFNLSNLSSTSGTFSFGFLGTATFTSIMYQSLAAKQNAPIFTLATVATATVICSAGTPTNGNAIIKGVLAINAGGTLIPAIGQSTASAAIVGVGSYFRIWAAGINTISKVGNWT